MQKQEITQPENSDLILLNVIECELKDSKTLEGFKNRLNDIRAIIEVSDKVSQEMSRHKMLLAQSRL
jgi:hypothetical protein